MTFRLVLAAAVLFGAAGAAAAAELNPGNVRDQTTQGRRLLKAPAPEYPAEERGRWTESCVALYFTVRPDGKTDGFVVLEVPRLLKPGEARPQTEAEKLQESRGMRRFVEPAIKALYGWQYAPGPRATDEIAVFRYERTAMGGQLMKFTARRLDLGTPDPKACAEALDVEEVRALVGKARAG